MDLIFTLFVIETVIDPVVQLGVESSKDDDDVRFSVPKDDVEEKEIPQKHSDGKGKFSFGIKSPKKGESKEPKKKKKPVTEKEHKKSEFSIGFKLPKFGFESKNKSETGEASDAVDLISKTTIDVVSGEVPEGELR